MENKLSNKEINKAVLGKTIQRPAAVYPLSLGILGGVSSVIFGANPLTLTILGVGLALGVGGFSAEYFFRKTQYANQYMKKIRKKMIEERTEKLQGLERNLRKVDELAGIRQIDLFREKYDNLLSILDIKLTPGEFTHTRYLTIAEQVFLGGLDNLQNIALSLKSISTIDISHINKEIKSLEKGEKTVTIDALRKREKLYIEQNERAKFLLEQNELALTQLDHVTTKLANIKTDQGHAILGIEDAMRDLQELIQRADNYSSH